MPNKRGRKRIINYQKVVRFAKKHPDMLQKDIGKKFGLTQSQVSSVLRQAKESRRLYRGRVPYRKENQNEDQAYWEKKLHHAGLGMDRGLRINNQRVLYGYDPAKEKKSDTSAT
jgi:hypothetical protein